MNSLESDDALEEDVPSDALDVWSVGANDCLAGAFWGGRGTVGRVHSKTVNGSASDLSYMRYEA